MNQHKEEVTNQFKYLVICDGGDGDISYSVENTAEEANARWLQDEEEVGYLAYAGVFEIDFENQTITRTHHCQ